MRDNAGAAGQASIVSHEPALHNASETALARRSAAEPRTSLHHVIVAGGGAAGLELVTRIGDKLAKRKKADATLIDRSRAHLWKPLLHEVAAGSMDDVIGPVRHTVPGSLRRVRFIGMDLGIYDSHRGSSSVPREFSYHTRLVSRVQRLRALLMPAAMTSGSRRR